MTQPDWQYGGFGIYLHWPFCQAKCPYCDFNSHVSANIDQARWKAAYLAEIRRGAAETPDRMLTSVFFGGGTPSLMAPDTVAAIISEIRSHWPTANDLEITLEANPTSVEAARFKAYRDAGVNRVSIGIQALNDTDLKRLGRLHSVAEARRAFDLARDCFDRVSFDLIYARQDQTLSDWEIELRLALAMAADHLSLYQLTIEDGTAFGARFAAGNLRGLPTDDLGADMYDLTQDLCESAGFPAYEVSNHARDLAQSRHNLIYWRGGEYLGLGPGAHGRITHQGMRVATETEKAPTAWLKRVEQAGSGETVRDPLADEDRAVEYMMMSLRLSEGTDLQRYSTLSGKNLSEKSLKMLEDEGLVKIASDRLTATATGRRVLNGILRELLT